MPNIKVKSSENEIFDIDVQIAKCSGTIKNILDDCGMHDAVVPLPNVSSAILRKVLHWANYHKDDLQIPVVGGNKDKHTVDISLWDAGFINVDQATLFELLLAANYLDIKGLLDVTCKTVANMMKGLTPEEIRNMFLIKNEEVKVRK